MTKKAGGNSGWVVPVCLSEAKIEKLKRCISFGPRSGINHLELAQLIQAIESAAEIHNGASKSSHSESVKDSRIRFEQAAMYGKQLCQQIDRFSKMDKEILNRNLTKLGVAGTLDVESVMLHLPAALELSKLELAPENTGRPENHSHTLAAVQLIKKFHKIFPGSNLSSNKNSRLYRVISFYLQDVVGGEIAPKTVINHAKKVFDS